ncbi:MAG TPA: amidohydrolase [Candidatus Krumholzibacteria bacterium]|nr:amidohydrolase [Candidatus Krumholzibacteria bacterium]
MSQGEVLVFENGVVRTLDPESPRLADWVLVEGGRVRRVGSGEPYARSEARRIDLGGRALIPAFTDAHVHLTWIATSFMGPDLSWTEDPEEVALGVGRWEEKGRGPGGEWIVGSGFDESTWTEKRLPTRRELDAAVKNRPVLVKRVCGHVGVVNSQALKDLPPGAHTDRESGRIAETDLWALNDRLRPGPAELAEILPRVVDRLHSHGITAVHDVTSAEMFRALQIGRARWTLPVRVSCSLPADKLASLRACGMQSGLGDATLRILGIKVFVDGSLGARTAFLREPYTDDAATRGAALYTPDVLAALVEDADAAGLQLMIHAIGDAGLERVLDVVGTRFANGNPLRHRLEHVEVTPPDLVHRLVASGLYACVQPNFVGRWSQPGGMNEQRLGARLAHCNAYRTLLRAGVPLSFGSDCMPLGPMEGLRAAVQHPDPAQGLSPLEAVGLYTAASAFVVGAEKRHGRIRPGMSADFAVLSEDPATPEGIANARVEATYFEGRRVYSREG